MSFPIFLLFAFLSFVICEKCSEKLRETFNKKFNLTEKCDGCVVQYPGISSPEGDWSGFCIDHQFFLFKNYNCSEEDDFLIKPDSLAVVTSESCEITDGNYHLDEECFRKFNTELCNESDGETSESVTVFHKRTTAVTKISTAKTTNTEETSTVTMSTEETSKEEEEEEEETSTATTNTEETEETYTVTTSTEKTSEEEEEEETSTAAISTEKTSTVTTSTEKTSTKTSKMPTELTKIITSANTDPSFSFSTSVSTPPTNPTTKFPIDSKNLCEPNEFFFKNHCYFILKYPNGFDSKHNKKEYISNLLNSTSTTEICKNRHPQSLALAVETEEENRAILKFLKTFRFYNNCIVFTSGFRKDGESRWMDWNLKINHSVLNLVEGDSQLLDAFYCINACSSYWYLVNSSTSNITNSIFYLICERPGNPRNILPELQIECIRQYRNSACYNIEKHSEYCCEKDEKGHLWFACLNDTSTKVYSFYQCLWMCHKTGFFHDRPLCSGNYSCHGSYYNINYVAPPTRYAISTCPFGLFGFSTWYCDENRNFKGIPDWSLCCNDTKLQCRNTDIFLNVWIGCPGSTIVKYTKCPPGSALKEASVKWYCQKNGVFKGATPDYSKCNITEVKCKKKDRYGAEWEGAIGTISVRACPPCFTGDCYWKCKENGMFDGPEPDCSKCKAAWMEDIDQKIKNHSHHEEVMEIMEKYTKKEDIRVGYEHVLNLTNDCVTLFKNQTCQSQISTFDKFLKSYSKILKNVAGNPNVWSSFSESNRGEFSEKILITTQSAAFAKLESENVTKEKYNVTLAESATDGFDFFVAYNLSVGSQFPLTNFSEKDWNLDVKNFNESNITFSAMGLVMNYTLSALMFPQGNDTDVLKINAPAITFKIATYKNGKALVEPNVTFTISFKHTNKTRFPATRLINRKLHKGEEPSGVFNSTSCYYYKDSQWTSEGCFVTFTSKERTNCTCYHLSTIGLLMTIHEYKPNKTLEIVSTISSGITIVSLIMALFVFYYFDKVKNDRVLISQNLCFCLLIGHIMLITVMDKKFFNIPDEFCTVYAVIQHYVFMAAFAWMLVEGCHLYRMLVLVFNSDVEYRRTYMFIGYGVPGLVVGITEIIGVVFKEQPYGQDELCWLKPPKYVWAFVGPVLVTTLVNFCILITAMKLAISSKRRTEKSNLATLKLWIKGWISLSSLLGITWLFGFFYINQNELFAYVFVVFNGLQGFFIFLFRCVLSDHYQSIFCKKLKHHVFISKSKSSKKSENAKTETKMYAISRTKSLSGEKETRDSGYDPGLDRLEEFKRYSKPKKNTSCDDVILKPEVSEAYLRNKMIARNFSIRKSKATWLGDSDDIPELSYHDIYSPN